MARTFPAHNPARFTPTDEQAALILDRQKRIQEWHRDVFRDDILFARLSDAENKMSFSGALWMIPVMVAKAAIINNGRNVLNNWDQFRVWMQVPWRSFAIEADHTQWSRITSLMGVQFYSIDFVGNRLSAYMWVPKLAPVMDGFSFINDIDALWWLGELGGVLPHEHHPLGTLINFPANIRLAAGLSRTARADALFGKPPYVTTLSEDAPAWVVLNAETGTITINPAVSIPNGMHQFTVSVTDAVPQTVEAAWSVEVTTP